MTIGEILIFLLLYRALNIEGWIQESYSFLKIVFLAPFASMPFFAQLDAYSRFQNYKKLKDQMYKYGFNLRILKPVLKSRCQRDAALVAAEELGQKEACMAYFHENGYRWYHLLPDFAFRSPQFLLAPVFWRTTFFVPYYASIYDFRLLHYQSEKKPVYAPERR
jgi:hypothetical protein